MKVQWLGMTAVVVSMSLVCGATDYGNTVAGWLAMVVANCYGSWMVSAAGVVW